MNESKYFSLYYTVDTTKYEDKNRFRNRVIMYLHDAVQRGSPYTTYQLCRQNLGLNIPMTVLDPIRHSYKYEVEKLLFEKDRSISEILDFISVVYDSWEIAKKDNQSIFKVMQDDLIQAINNIFQEESMCYVLHHNGRVRYYPDDEFYTLIKCTLTTLNNPKYSEQLDQFNSILDDFYKYRNSEMPIQKLHKIIESFILSIVRKKFNIINEKSVDELMNIITSKLSENGAYTNNDIEAIAFIKDQIFKWNKMCHKYRHGKPDQKHENVPEELFHYIFSEGVNIYRLLLKLDEKLSIIN